MNEPIRILFLCTGNSCRSQMAEGLARSMSKGRIEAYSAGSAPMPVHPLAVKVMAEVDIDISDQKSKSIEPFIDQKFDFVITVCDRMKEACPVWPDVREQIHWSLTDPAEAQGTEPDRLRVFRRVRDELRQRLQLFMLANRIVGREAGLR